MGTLKDLWDHQWPGGTGNGPVGLLKVWYGCKGLVTRAKVWLVVSRLVVPLKEKEQLITWCGRQGLVWPQTPSAVIKALVGLVNAWCTLNGARTWTCPVGRSK